MKKSISITLACAIGSGLGAMCAIALGAFWVVGLILGAVIGYFIYDFNQVIKALPEAWEYAQEKVEFLDGKFFASLGRWALAFGACLVYPCALAITATNSSLTPFFNEIGVMLGGGAGIVFFVLATCGMIGMMLLNIITTLDKFLGREEDQSSMTQTKKMGIYQISVKTQYNHILFGLVLLFSPIVGTYIGLRILTLMALPSVAKYLWQGMKFTRVFIWKLIKLIHSDIRLLVGIDSFIGGAVGFYFQSPFIGMAVGAIWGLINYQVVSIRLLKLKPVH